MKSNNQYESGMESTVIIIGAGASGLAAAHSLRERGISVRILEKTHRAGDAWYHRHPQLRLNSHRTLSTLPGRSIPKSAGTFPHRDSIIEYLDSYAKNLDVPIEYNIRVNRIDRRGLNNHWIVDTSAGQYKSRHVIVATGLDSKPFIPAWRGIKDYTGKIVHAANFGSVNHYQGKKVLVVGAGNSGSDILNHLSKIDTEQLWISVRNGPVVFPQKLFGFPVQLLSPLLSALPVTVVDKVLALMERLVFGNLRKWGLTKHAEGGATRLLKSGVAPAIDNGFIAAIKSGKINVVPEIQNLESDSVRLINQQQIKPDIIIAATGYRTGLEPMLGHLNILDADGVPIFNAAEQLASAPRLWFSGMRAQLSGFFLMASTVGAGIADAIVKIERSRSDVAQVEHSTVKTAVIQ